MKHVKRNVTVVFAFAALNVIIPPAVHAAGPCDAEFRAAYMANLKRNTHLKDTPLNKLDFEQGILTYVRQYDNATNRQEWLQNLRKKIEEVRPKLNNPSYEVRARAVITLNESYICAARFNLKPLISDEYYKRKGELTAANAGLKQ